MKPAAFRYFAPRSLDEALDLLAEHGEEAKVLAGGQSLVPAMNFRLAQPAVLVDLNRVAELSYIGAGGSGERAGVESAGAQAARRRGAASVPAASGGGSRSAASATGPSGVAGSDHAPSGPSGVRSAALRIGAMTRQRAVEKSADVARLAPLLHRAMPFIAHPQIRNRGTVGGSLAHADPAAELPAVALALDARLLLRRQDGERWVAARDFYVGLFATVLGPGEMLAEVELPPAPARTGWSFQEISRRHGDFALAGVAAGVTLFADGRVAGARIALLGVGEGPIVAEQAAAILAGAAVVGGVLDGAALAAAAEAAVAGLDPPSDIHASARFRRHLAGVMVERAVAAAVRDAAHESRPGRS